MIDRDALSPDRTNASSPPPDEPNFYLAIARRMPPSLLRWFIYGPPPRQTRVSETKDAAAPAQSRPEIEGARNSLAVLPSDADMSVFGASLRTSTGAAARELAEPPTTAWRDSPSLSEFRETAAPPSTALPPGTEPEAEPEPDARQKARGGRFEPLDVLRGLAVLGMALSGMVPSGTLPAWMYHAQLPPPTGAFNDRVYGITWVDLVFPFFLFSMGAAIPLSLGGRLNAGLPRWRVAVGLMERGLLLAAYSLIGQHLRPYVMSGNPDGRVWAYTLLGFGFIGLMLLRWPSHTPKWGRAVAGGVGWAGALYLLLTWTYPDGTTGFANYRNDIILLVLANVAVSGGLIWLFTRTKPGARWLCFGVVAAIFLTANQPGVGQIIWNWTPTQTLRDGPYGRFIPILYHFEFHKYLLIVIPGTFVGDMLRRARESQIQAVTSPFGALVAEIALAFVGPAACAVACAGLLAREVVSTTVWLGGLVGAAWLLISRFADVRKGVPARLFEFGAPILLIGLLCEPLGGGIRKDSPTFSYFLVTAGLGSILLSSLTCIGMALKRTFPWRLVSDTGVNPIMGYLIITNLTMGLVGITGLEASVNAATQDPYRLLAWAGVKTLFVALATMVFTRVGVFLRA